MFFAVIIVDISSKVNGDPNFVLHKQDLDYILNDNLGKPCLIVFKFGWTKFFYTDKYMGYDRSTNKLNFPGEFALVRKPTTDFSIDQQLAE